MHRRDHVGIHPQRDGRTFVGVAPRAGRLTGHQLRLVADLAERYGDGRIRTTTRQKLAILGVEPDAAAELGRRLDDLDLPSTPAPFRKGVMACTGIEFCKLAIGETKGRARWLAEELDRRLAGLDEEIRVHVNGCPNSCARFQVADIGLMSALARRPDGTRSDAFLVHLGGGLGVAGGGTDGDSFGRKVKGVKILAEDAADYVETLVRRYRVWRGADTTTFSAFVRGLDDEELARFARPEGTR
jgi:sulfite reductase (ferredoxin)